MIENNVKSYTKQGKKQLQLSSSPKLITSYDSYSDQLNNYFIILKNQRGNQNSSSHRSKGHNKTSLLKQIFPQQPKRKLLIKTDSQGQPESKSTSHNYHLMKNQKQYQTKHLEKNQQIPMLVLPEKIDIHSNEKRQQVKDKEDDQAEVKSNPQYEGIRQRIQKNIRKLQAKILRKKEAKYEAKQFKLKRRIQERLMRLRSNIFPTQDTIRMKKLLQEELQRLKSKINAGNLTFKARKNQENSFLSISLTEITEQAIWLNNPSLKQNSQDKKQLTNVLSHSIEAL